MASEQAGEPNVWLIAGGGQGLRYYEIGPMLSRRIEGAYLIGETREKLRAA
jgi:UDP-N-acetylmuramoylalanine-D-glutamate ligase